MGPSALTVWRRRIPFHPAILSSVLVGLLGAAWLAIWPIVRLDTDLWFHLDYGRYMIQHLVIPRTSFFSFLSPPLEFVDQSWLFQVLVYGVFSIGGYYGLLALRVSAYALMAGLMARYVFFDRGRPVMAWRAGLVLALVCTLLLFRYQNIRPHIVTYGLIMTFLYILECRPRQAGWLPLLAVLWCNLHGITYPVLLLVCGAYALEYVVDRSRGRPLDPQQERRFFMPIVLSMLAIYATPHGTALLGLPFLPLGYNAHVVQELVPLDLAGLLSFTILKLTLTYDTLFNIFVWVAGFAILRTVWARKLRVSHAVLMLGACILLSRGNRFIYEFVLLSMPLLRASPLLDDPGPGKPRTAGTFLLATLIGMTALPIGRSLMLPRPRYPFSTVGLPDGVDAFLNAVDAKGAVLNPLNTGGYHRWKLDSRYKIFLDMGFPGYPNEFLYLGERMLLEKRPLELLRTRYDPSFISAPIGATKFQELIREFPDYRMVFFDDAEILYANRLHYPDLVSRYELVGIDPAKLRIAGQEAFDSDAGRGTLLAQMRRMLEVYPEGCLANQVAAEAHIRNEAYDQALPHADAVIRNCPARSVGYRQAADALRELHSYRRAASFYRKALRRAGPAEQPLISKGQGVLYTAQGRYQHAYQAFVRAIDVLSLEATPEDLYTLATAARRAGKRKEAEALILVLATYKISAEDPVWSQRLKAEAAHLGLRLEDLEQGRGR